MRLSVQTRFPGAYSCGDTPVPIPNTEVKSTAPRVLTWRRVGRVGSARIKLKGLEDFFFKAFFVALEKKAF